MFYLPFVLSTKNYCHAWNNDDYETTKKCHAVYKQLKELKTINHPLTGQEIKIMRCTSGDAKEIRLSTGSSPAKSTYPILKGSEHQSQLGNMKIICPEPVWTGSDAESCQKKIWLNCVERPPPKKSTESLPNKILGTLGVKIWMVLPWYHSPWLSVSWNTMYANYKDCNRWNVPFQTTWRSYVQDSHCTTFRSLSIY